jgi:hypothetical protein
MDQTNDSSFLFTSVTTAGKKREEHDLRNRILHVDWNNVEDETISQSANHEVQSAKAGEELPPKCKNCTLPSSVRTFLIHTTRL